MLKTSSSGSWLDLGITFNSLYLRCIIDSMSEPSPIAVSLSILYLRCWALTEAALMVTRASDFQFSI